MRERFVCWACRGAKVLTKPTRWCPVCQGRGTNG